MAAPKVAHVVFFTLKDRSPAGIRKQIDECNKYLTDHTGVLFYGVGPRTAGLEREVNDRDFDVALHMLFENRAAHDQYQVHPRHVKFIEDNKPHWAKVRVFDADV
jgi:hypothetical protein